MPTSDDYANWIVQNEERKGTPEFATVAHAYRLAKQQEQDANLYDPTEGMAGWQKAAAGAGKGVSDMWNGLRQLASNFGEQKSLGQVAFGTKSPIQQEIDDTRVRDSPLMQSGLAKGGYVAGQLATMLLPGAVVGGAARAAGMAGAADAIAAASVPRSIAGGAANGAAWGAAQPVATGDSRGRNMLESAVGGAAFPAAGAVLQAGKALASPLYQAGRESIAGRTLQRFANDPGTIARAPEQGLIPGSVPTLADATQDIGVAQLQRAMRNNPDANIPISERMVANTQARRAALDTIAGDEGQVAWHKAERDTIAGPLYDTAFAQQAHDTPWIKGQITQLQQRPAFQQAWSDAADIAANQGIKLDPENMTQVAHFAKMALDDQLSAAVRAGNNQAARGIADTKGKLVSLMESDRFAPAYRDARQTYAQLSRPINQMEVGQSLRDTYVPAISDTPGSAAANAASYAKALRNGDATAAKVLGQPGATLDKVMDPAQMQTLHDVASELKLANNAETLGKVPGSPTAQNMVAQDVLARALGPVGIPTFAQSLIPAFLPGLAQKSLGALSKLGGSEKEVLGLLGEAIADPKRAKALLAAAQQRGRVDRITDPMFRMGGPAGVAGLLGLSQ